MCPINEYSGTNYETTADYAVERYKIELEILILKWTPEIGPNVKV